MLLLLYFSLISSVTARLSQIMPLWLDALSSASACGHPLMVHVVGTYRCSSSCVASCISYADMYSEKSAYISIALMLSFILGITWFLFLQWFCLDNQFVCIGYGPGLYMMCMLYWCMQAFAGECCGA